MAGGKGCGLLFKKGEILRKVPEEGLADALLDLIESEAGPMNIGFLTIFPGCMELLPLCGGLDKAAVSAVEVDAAAQSMASRRISPYCPARRSTAASASG